MTIYPKKLEEHIYLHKKGIVAEAPPVKQGRLLVRLLLLAFTLLCGAAILGMTYFLFELRSQAGLSAALVLLALPFYVLGERLIVQRHFYRFGIEEALTLGAVGMLCGVLAIFADKLISGRWDESLMAAGVCALFYAAYRRLGYFLAALISLVALCSLPFILFESEMEGRLTNFVVLALLFWVNTRVIQPRLEWNFERARARGFEAIFFAAAYVFMNLRLYNFNFNYPRWYYWTTYAVIVLLPLSAIAYALRSKHRPLLDVALIGFLLTLLTNKSYLNKPRTDWDPMILGVFLVGLAVAAQKWLAKEKNKQRFGLTSEKTGEMNLEGLDLASLGPWLKHTPSSQASTPGGSFSGGESGGGGASRSF